MRQVVFCVVLACSVCERSGWEAEMPSPGDGPVG